MATPKVVPRADGEGTLGTASLKWGAGHFDALNVGTPKVTGIESFTIAVSDEATQLSVGDDKVKFAMPYAFTLTEVKAFVSTAPTGAALTLQVTEAGAANDLTSSAVSISASANTANTTSFGDSSLAEDAVIGINIDQVGSTEPGRGLKVTLIGYQS
jgi:hypothetical protein